MLWRPRQQCNFDYPRLLNTFFQRQFSSRVLRREEALVILGVPYNATKPEVKEAFIRLSKTLHPDVNTSVNANEEFQRVKSAYDVLMNSKHSDTIHSQSRDEGFYQQASSAEWRHWQSRQRKTKEFDDWMKNVARERRQGKGRRVVKEDNFDFNEGWMGWGWERPAGKRSKSQKTGKREVRNDHFDSFSIDMNQWGWEKQKNADDKKEEFFDKMRKQQNIKQFKHAEEPFVKFVDMMFCLPLNQIPQHSVAILKLLMKVSIVLSLFAIVGISYEIREQMNFDRPSQNEARPDYVEAVKQKSGTLNDL